MAVLSVLERPRSESIVPQSLSSQPLDLGEVAGPSPVSGPAGSVVLAFPGSAVVGGQPLPQPRSRAHAVLLVGRALRQIEDPVVLAVPASSPLTGERWPLRAITDVAHEYAARVLVDVDLAQGLPGDVGADVLTGWGTGAAGPAYAARRQRVADRLELRLAQVPGLSVRTDWCGQVERVGVATFTLDGWPASALADHLKRGHRIHVGVRDGSVHVRLGHTATVADVDRLGAALLEAFRLLDVSCRAGRPPVGRPTASRP